MALTFNTGMTSINAGDSVTNWGAWRAGGSGAAPAPLLDNVTYKEGSGSISARMAGASANGGLIFDYYTANANTVLNLTTAGNEVLAIWALCTSPGAILTANAGGMWVVVQSSAETGNTAPTVYSRWYVSGSEVYPGGWVLFMVDTRKTPSLTAGGGANLASVRRIGLGITLVVAPPTLRSDNLYVDAMWYGRPNYRVVGDGATTCRWADFLNHSQTAKNGLINDLGGAYGLNCGIQFGATNQAATTTFNDATGRTAIFQRQVYYNAGAVSGTYDALNYADYYIVQGVGAVAQKTSVSFGSAVGVGTGRQGVLGGSLLSADPANVTWKVDFATGAANLTAAKFNGVIFNAAKGGLSFDNNAGATLTDLISCQFVNCGEVIPGATGNGATILNCSLIDPQQYGMTVKATHNVSRLSCITSGTPATQYMLRFPDATNNLQLAAVKFYGDYSTASLWHGHFTPAVGDLVIQASLLTDIAASEVYETSSGIVSVNNPVTVTLTGIQTGSEVRVYTHGTITERAGVESVAGSTFAYAYTYQANDYVDIVVHHTDWIYYRLDNFLLPGADGSIPIQQQKDRQYSNPV